MPIERVEGMNDKNGLEVGKEIFGWLTSQFWHEEYKNMFVDSSESTGGRNEALDDMRDRKTDVQSQWWEAGRYRVASTSEGLAFRA